MTGWYSARFAAPVALTLWTGQAGRNPGVSDELWVVMPQRTFRNLASLDDALDACRDRVAALLTEPESVSLEQAVGRVLGTSTTAAAPLPHFRRSTMDGYAVRAADTFGASLSAPALLKLVGAVRIGRPPEVRPQPG